MLSTFLTRGCGNVHVVKSRFARLTPSLTFFTSSAPVAMDLQAVVKVLQSMASPSLAGSWDNIGLLVEPSPPHSVSRLLLTNDLTPAVMREAVGKKVDMLVSYHPPIFAPLKRVTQQAWKERMVAECLEHRVALYSPHTSWDAVAGGVNDWLIQAFDVTDVKPLEQTEEMAGGRKKKLTFCVKSESLGAVKSLPILSQQSNIRMYTEPALGSAGDATGKSKVCVQCAPSAIPTIFTAMSENNIDMETVEICDLAKVPLLGFGMGRIGQLTSPISMQTAVSRVKAHLGLKHVRLAEAEGTKEIGSVAVCAGSGSSVLRGAKADLWVTGEMSHHELLDAVAKGTTVILCDHSNTERGFLKVVQGRLTQGMLPGVEVIVSEKDRDPLEVV